MNVTCFPNLVEDDTSTVQAFMDLTLHLSPVTTTMH